MFGPQRSKMNILAYFSTSIHLDGLAFELGKLEFYGSTWVGGRDFKLKFELIANEVVSVGTDSLPFDAVFGRLNFEPVVVLLFIGLDVQDDGLKFLFEPVFPLGVLGSCMDGEKRNF